MTRGARVILGVRGLADPDDQSRVAETLRELHGVLEVRAGDVGPEVGQLEVRYDDRETTVMEMIRAVRRLGYLAGME